MRSTVNHSNTRGERLTLLQSYLAPNGITAAGQLSFIVANVGPYA